jgi:hypothetical protein
MLDLGEANSLADLIKTARTVEQQFGNQVWFRGHAQHDWKLVPSAYRRNPALESEFANHFRLRAPSFAKNCPAHMDYSSWLPLMQHYGLPTRLLDWTESLLIAAFFAVVHKLTTHNGAIWMLAPGNLNEQSIGPWIPFLTHNQISPLVEAAFSKKDEPRHSVAVLAPRTDPRMTAQLGNYTIHGSREPLEEHPASSSFLARVLIPSASQESIRGDLSVSGIRLSSLFPDLSHLAAELSELVAFGAQGEDLEK